MAKDDEADEEIAARFEAVADELYGLRPEEFTPTRTEREKQARAEGDRDLANQIKALRKPTMSAWMANLLARERADQVEPLAELGAAFTEAQENLEGDQLRELSRQRTRLVSGLVREARKLALEHGVRATDTAVRELEETLEACLADPDAASVLVAGRLTTSWQHTGFGAAITPKRATPPPTGTSRSAPKTPPRPPAPPKDKQPPDELAARRAAAARREAEAAKAKARQQAQGALDEALAEQSDAERGLAEATSGAEEVVARQQDSEARVTRLEEELRTAEEALPGLRRDARKAERERDQAETARDRADRAVEKARAALAELDG